MSDCDHNPKNAKIVIRAREAQEKWGQKQVLECRDCGERWSE